MSLFCELCSWQGLCGIYTKKVLLQNHFSCEINENKSVLTVKSIYVKKSSVQIPKITKSGILEQTFSV